MRKDDDNNKGRFVRVLAVFAMLTALGYFAFIQSILYNQVPAIGVLIPYWVSDTIYVAAFMLAGVQCVIILVYMLATTGHNGIIAGILVANILLFLLCYLFYPLDFPSF